MHNTVQPQFKGPQYGGRGWFRARLKRHMVELVRLAAPVMMRLGLMALGIVDIAMVGHYATTHLAWLNLANQSYVMFAIVVSLGLLMGVVVHTSNAYGRDDLAACGRVWRRTLPFSACIATLMLILGFFGEWVLLRLGQTPENAAAGGTLILILSVGLPAHVFFINCSMFLEGVKRPEVGFYIMIAANLVNVILNYALIYGHFGAPELGSEGSAWASTGVRLVMCGLMIGYIWYAPSIQKFGVRNPHGQKWHDWADQRKMGYASAVSLTAEVIAFSALALFAGWISTVALASHGVVYQVLGIPLMISLGIGIAASVRTSIAHGRGDSADTLLAGLSGLALGLFTVIFFGVIIILFTRWALGIFSDDMRIITLLLPMTLLYTAGMIFDAMQMIISNILRGLGETWWPTVLQFIAFIGVMLPACYLLAFPMERGFLGLMEGMTIGVIVSFALQIWRFVWLMRSSNPSVPT